MGEHEEGERMQAAAEKENLVPLGTKVRESTRKRLRRFSVDTDTEMREVIDEALDLYLRERDY